MMKSFKNLEKGNYVWVVWDINWDKSIPSKYIFYPSEYEIKKCLVLDNKIDQLETRDIGDRWEENIITVSTNYITIFFKNIEYLRRYDGDVKKQMIIHPPFNKKGPEINVFIEEQDAKDYVIALCEDKMKGIEKQIKELEFEKSLVEKTLNKL